MVYYSKKKILVCDSQNFISKILKKNFGEEFEIERLVFFISGGGRDYLNFLIYVIYNEEEFVLFKNMFSKKKNVIVYVFNIKMLKELSRIQKDYGFFLFDGTDKIKGEIALQFKSFLYFPQMFTKDLF
jgi:hypothetical protein